MLRRIFRFLLCIAFAFNVVVAPAATDSTLDSPAVNVKYIHDAIYAKWGVSVGYNPQLTNKSAIANMKYLLAAIDIANKKIGVSSKVYSGTSYATSYAVNKRTADTAIETLITNVTEPQTFPFTATTTSTTSFSFTISAAGEFKVDWGDGSDIQVITKTSTDSQTISHTYTTAAAYDIEIGGLATAYSTGMATAAISFASNTSLAGISGSLGAIFPTLSDGSQPRFYRTFYRCTNLTGNIPAGLFVGISGAPATYMFANTFYYCRNLTGSIPEGLFGNLSGAPVYGMFEGTFFGCSGLTGEIPLGLFGNLSGAPDTYMFKQAFYGCSGLTGKSARNPDGTYLYDVFSTATTLHVYGMYTGTCLEDNASIPSAWGGKTCTYTGS